jgi:Zn-dependent peptidase ImmA (M78 family)/transcriptional regulator with XRE-family HTH domain
MATNYALITPAVLTWARERLALSEQAIADKLGIKLEKYKSWESGGAKPTVRKAKEFAKKTKISFAWLYLPEPPRKFDLPKNVDYRTFGNAPVEEKLAPIQSLIADATMRRDAMIEIYKERGIDLPSFNARANIEKDDALTISKAIRELLGITTDKQAMIGDPAKAFRYFRDTLGSIGILVFQANDINKNLLRGLSLYCDVFPIIVVNRKDEYNARVFSLFHELAHILTRTSGVCNNMDIVGKSQFEIEVKCNKIAAEALVPRADLLADTNLNKLLENWDDRLVRNIARRFTTSREVIVGRLFELEKISFAFYRQRMRQYTAEHKAKEKMDKEKILKKGFLSPAKDIYSQVGSLYASTIINSYHDEKITPLDMSHYLSGLKIQQFEKFEKEFVS